MEMLGQIYDPLALPQRKEHQYPLEGRLGGPSAGLDAVDNATFVIQDIQSAFLLFDNLTYV
jgi:hypothetical protein